MLAKLTIFLQKTLCLHKNLAKHIKKRRVRQFLHVYLVNLQMSEACFGKNEGKNEIIFYLCRKTAVLTRNFASS